MTPDATSPPASAAREVGPTGPGRPAQTGAPAPAALSSPAVSPTSAARDAGSLAYGAAGLLQVFNEAGVLGLADVHTAETVSRIAGVEDDPVRLALALAVRALRNGSVCVDLATVSSTVFDEAEEGIDVSRLPWPDADDWLAACRSSRLVTVGGDHDGGRPLRLNDGLLYLERYWLQEELVREQLQLRFAAEAPSVNVERVRTALDRLFTGDGLAAGEPDRQRLAAAVSTLSWVTVLAGGPGTGKTTTVARLLALLSDQDGPRPRIALAAPTGKAAARLEEAVRSAAARLDPQDRDRLGDLQASTLHRLLGWQPGNRGRFRHHALNHLPHDVVIVDEMSMVSLTMMARLLEAVRPSARLVLVGDPDQLSSVEAGAVLADIARAPGVAPVGLAERLQSVGMPASGPDGSRPDASRPDPAGSDPSTTEPTGPDPTAPDPTGPAPEPADPEESADRSEEALAPVVHGVVQLSHTWRFGGAIGSLARAIRAAKPDEAMRILRSGADDVRFTDLEDAGTDPAGAVHPATVPASGLTGLAAEVRTAGAEMRRFALAGDVTGALAALDRHRLLCAHRRGPFGVVRWSLEAEHWLAEGIPGYGEDGEWYVGRPLLVTANDYDMGLYNGDTGVIVETPDGIRAAFARGAEATLYPPVRLDAVQTVHAMTVHRAQGCQFDTVSFVVPPADSPLLTRELLYTAVTRATKRVQVFGTEAAVRRAVERPANRASGLRHRLALPS
ncbi:MAG: recD [Friedmanniella sp.]|nr:recD [Friedmanniella sp.]